MRVEVVYALARDARTVTLELPAGATLRDALEASGFELDVERQAFGVFGKRGKIHPFGCNEALGKRIRVRFVTDENSALSVVHEHVVVVGRKGATHGHVAGVDTLGLKSCENSFTVAVTTDI